MFMILLLIGGVVFGRCESRMKQPGRDYGEKCYNIATIRGQKAP